MDNFSNIKCNSSRLQLSKIHTKMTTLETTDLFLDCLYCEEKCWDDDHDDDDHVVHAYDDDDDNGFGSSYLSPLHEDSLFSCEDEDEQLNALFLKEKKQSFFSEGILDSNKLLVEARKEGLEWMIRINSYHNFSTITMVLGVNYFDRFILSFGFKAEMSWMIHVAAIACLSLASKIEESHVLSLLDFQVENKQIYEAKVIQRMELLVLTTLEWKMNAVTPLSYFGHLIRKLNLKTHLHWKVLCRYERLIIYAVLDPKSLSYVPSVLAASTMVQTLKEIGLWSTQEQQIDIMDTLKLDKDKVEVCYKFIQELSSNKKVQKRDCYYISANKSPNNVFDVISSESSNKDLSSGPLPKKCRIMGPPCFG